LAASGRRTSRYAKQKGSRREPFSAFDYWQKIDRPVAAKGPHATHAGIVGPKVVIVGIVIVIIARAAIPTPAD
jgi:hypothetical protein